MAKTIERHGRQYTLNPLGESQAVGVSLHLRRQFCFHSTIARNAIVAGGHIDGGEIGADFLMFRPVFSLKNKAGRG